MAPFGRNFLKARLKNRTKDTEAVPGKEIQVSVCDEDKVVCGVTKHTTCADVVRALLDDHKSVPESKRLLDGDPKDFCLLERWKGFERALPPLTRILRLWNAWGDQKPFIQFLLVKTSDFVPQAGKKGGKSKGAKPKRWEQGPAQYSQSLPVERQKRVVKKAFRKLEKIHKEKKGSPGAAEVDRMVQLIISQDHTIRQQIRRMRDLDSEIERCEVQATGQGAEPDAESHGRNTERPREELYAGDGVDELCLYAGDGVDQPHLYAGDGVDQPRLYASDGVDQPRLYASDGVDQPRLYASDGVDQPRLYASDGVDQPRLYASDGVDQLRLYTSDGVDQPRLYTNDGVDQLEMQVQRHRELILQLSRDIDAELAGSPRVWPGAPEEDAGATSAPVGAPTDAESSFYTAELERLQSELKCSLSAGVSLHTQAAQLEKELNFYGATLTSKDQECWQLAAQLSSLQVGEVAWEAPRAGAPKGQAQCGVPQAARLKHSLSPAADVTDTDSDTGISSTHSQDSLSPAMDFPPPLDTDV